MRNSVHSTKKRLTALIGTGALVISGAAAAAMLTAGTANAVACTSSGQTDCTVGGSSDVSSGTLTVQGPASISFNDTLSGLNQQIAGTPAAGASYAVVDATGSADGWEVSAAASTFTGTLTGPDTLPNTDALVFDASSSNPDDTSGKPESACLEGSTCTEPTDNLSYPVSIGTDADGTDEPEMILNAEAATGLGSIDLGTFATGIFWLSIPANALADTYSSTITLSIESGPSGTT